MKAMPGNQLHGLSIGAFVQPGHWIPMSSNDLISLCGAIRTSIDTVHELASGIDADVGRRQIYGDTDAIHRALERMRALATTIEILENQLVDCTSLTIERPRKSREHLRSSPREAA